MRRCLQLAFLVVFITFFFSATYGVLLPADLLLRLDPLLGLSTFIAARQLSVPLLLSFFVLASALLAGRIFCGFICPLGTLFDLLPARNHAVPLKATPVNTVFFWCIALCCLWGINLAGIADPLALLSRVLTFVVRPVLDGVGTTFLDAARPAAEHLHWVRMARASLSQSVYAYATLTALILIGLGMLNWYSRRVWCRSVCPLGALLGICSQVALFRRRVTSRCTRCMQCVHACPMGAISNDPAVTWSAHCIMCHTCSHLCPEAAIQFSPSPSIPSLQQQAFRYHRRTLLAACATSAFAIFSLRATPAHRSAQQAVLRPPGAVPENIFLQRCVRCGLCMAVCPTNTLQPCLFEATLEGIWSPRVVPRHAGCDQTCNRCGAVCPTGALRSLSLDEKKHAKIGTAWIDTNRCLVWSQSRVCFICDEQCPYNAIIFKWHEGVRKPFVIDVRCNGCGLCEQQCPVAGASAIIVTPQGELRLLTGSYLHEAHKLQLELKEDPGADHYLPEDTQSPPAPPPKNP